MHRFVVVSALACAGCVDLMSPPGSWGGAGASSSFTTDQGTVRRGISELTLNGRPYLVLLSAGGESLSTSSGPRGSGRIKTADGREIGWTCVTRDGVSGTLVVGGRSYRLEDGGVVLVDLRGGKTVVEQAAADMSRFGDRPVEEQLKLHAATDPRVAQFLRATETPK